MPRFSKSSMAKLKMCDPLLMSLFLEVIKHYDCIILETWRSKEKQNTLVDEGRSKVTWPNSKHNTTNNKPGMVKAVDVVPYPLDWSNSRKNIYRYYQFSGIVIGIALRMNIGIRWGGDWDRDFDFNDQNFNDLPHYELID